ncbi:MAG TPA: hypothetical protein VMV48_04325 [Gallionellaceae bacterium]|nr:hypothetical protein [Gallionellaceae bacterium]
MSGKGAAQRDLIRWVGGIKRQNAQRPSLTLRVVRGNEKAGAGGFVRHGFFVDAHDPRTAAVA